MSENCDSTIRTNHARGPDSGSDSDNRNNTAVATRLPGRFNSDYYFFMLLDETSQSIKSPVEVACLRMTL